VIGGIDGTFWARSGVAPKRRTVLAGATASVLAGGVVFADAVVEFAGADAGDAVSLEFGRSVRWSDAPETTVTVWNDALGPVRTNLAIWRVRHGGERLIPETWVQPLHELWPGQAYDDTVRLGGEPT
jgi:hypothetical protein